MKTAAADGGSGGSAEPKLDILASSAAIAIVANLQPGLNHSENKESTLSFFPAGFILNLSAEKSYV